MSYAQSPCLSVFLMKEDKKQAALVLRRHDRFTRVSFSVLFCGRLIIASVSSLNKCKQCSFSPFDQRPRFARLMSILRPISSLTIEPSLFAPHMEISPSVVLLMAGEDYPEHSIQLLAMLSHASVDFTRCSTYVYWITSHVLCITVLNNI
jgi:hypothetical protein